MAERSCDVLVIGSGVAGLTAALAAADAGARVLLATKLGLASSNTAKAQGGIQAALGDDDEPSVHAADVIRSSHETANPRLVAALTGEAPDAIARLERFGVAFTHDADGRYRLARCGGATRKRLLQVGDRTGHAIATSLRAAIGADARVETLDHAPLRALEPAAAGWRATLGQRDGGSLAVPPAQSCWRRAGAATPRPSASGRSPRTPPGRPARSPRSRSRQAARRATWTPCSTTRTADSGRSRMQGYSIPETTRAYGAVLLNANGERFVDELGGRDVVAAAIVRECEQGRGLTTPEGRPSVLLDCRPIPVADAEISLPFMLKRYRAAGIDPLAEPIHTYPVLHYQNGGLVIDEHGATTVEGLYAAGEITGGVHGRNRMMGNSLLDGSVFGWRAGHAAAAAVA